MNDAEPVIVAQRHHQLRQCVVGDAGTELAVERVRGRLAERESVDLLDSLAEFWGFEERAFRLAGVALQTLVRTKTRARGPPQLSAHGFLLGSDQFDGLADQLMMILLPGERRCVGCTLGRLQNLELRFGDGITVRIEPGERVVVLGRSQIDEHAVRLVGGRSVRAGGVDDRRQGRDGLLQLGETVNGVFPDLVGVRCEVHLGLSFAVEDARFLVVEIEKLLPLAFVLEEGLVRADHLGILVETLPHAGTKSDQILDALCGQEGIAEDLFGLLSDAIHAAGALDEPDDRPGQIEVHDDGAVLEVLTLAQNVCRDQDPKFLIRRDLVALAVAFGAEAPSEARRILGFTCDTREPLNIPGAKLRLQVAHGVSELREDDDLVIRMILSEQLMECFELGVLGRIPVSTARKDGEKAGGVVRQVRGKGPDEEVGTKPFETALELVGISLIGVGSPSRESATVRSPSVEGGFCSSPLSSSNRSALAASSSTSSS